MLVLTRKVSEEIIINNEIVVKFLKINNRGQMVIGIEAPKNMPVHRREIQEKINLIEKGGK